MAPANPAAAPPSTVVARTMAPIGRPTIWAARTLPPTTSTAKPTIVCRMSTHVTTHATTPKTRPQWMPVAGIVPIIRRSPMAHDAGDEGRVNVERVEAAERDEPAEDPEGGQQGGGRDGRRLRPRRAPHAVTS